MTEQTAGGTDSSVGTERDTRPPRLLKTRSLSLDIGRVAVDQAVEEAYRIGCVTCVAVVDNAGHLLSFDRMDGAPLLSGSSHLEV